MAFTNLSISLREVSLTTFIPDLAVIFNTNDSKLKSEIEKIINGLYINTTTGIIGEPDGSGIIPVTEINSRTMFVVLPGTPAVGPKFGFKNTYSGSVVAGVNYDATAVAPYTITYASELYSMVAGTASAGWKAYFDKLVITSVMQSQTCIVDIMQLSNPNGLLESNAPAQFNGPVMHRSGHKESSLDSVKALAFDGTVLYCEYDITRATVENNFVYLQCDATAYSGGWSPLITGIELRLVIDQSLTDTLPMSGQIFNFMLRGIIDASGVPIAEHPPVNVVIKAAQTVPGTDDFAIKNYGHGGSAHAPVTEIVFVPNDSLVTDNSLDTYGASVSLMYNKETQPAGSIYYPQNNIMYVRNAFFKES